MKKLFACLLLLLLAVAADAEESEHYESEGEAKRDLTFFAQDKVEE